MWIYYSFITYMYSIRISTSTGVCSNASSPLKCCLNYRVVGNSCVECWPGTHGVDCKYFCPPSFYGKSCLRKCDCEPCDKVTGCLNATGSKNQMAPLENSRFSISKTPRTIDLSQTYDTETSYGKCQTTVSNNMTETTSRNDYGCDDSMDGAYKILKVTVSDKNEHMQIPNKTSTPLEIQKHTNVHEDTSQMASSVSNIVKTKNHESKPSIHREKKKHQKELLRALDEFKQGSTRDRKKLRYSFTKSTELF
ncbi:uncharacterized protein LOC128180626 isoform X1 [Crassostrea angulata]|uniref:uncharacterized protein LOC128180626 isoform X1 n=1 Tax=Magallana angulata TaxID=2784310 RepID=UPI0022B1CF57|nr:uncharacterized protein LOC128180626 isoform X1 [Crassostrea angulata]